MPRVKERLNHRTIELGRELFAGMRDVKPGLFSSERWTAEVLEWAMKDKAFKTELFRFVDVFPVLDSPAQVATHLEEYLLRPDLEAPLAVKVALRGAATGLGARVATAQLTKNLTGMAQRFIAGETAASAAEVAELLRKEGCAFSVDLLGEAVVGQAEAGAYEARVHDLLEQLSDAAARWPGSPTDADDAGELPRVNVSLKLSALLRPTSPLATDADLPDAITALSRVFRHAKDRGAAINVDMEHSALKELTLRAFMGALELPEFSGWRHAAIAVQAYLRCAEDDLEALIRWARRGDRRITVRLVKGAYWDAEVSAAAREGWPSPVWAEKWESDASYERCLALLVKAHPHVRVAVASHNLRSIAAALALGEAAGLPKGALEFQSLYGMAEPVRATLLAAGQRVRVYCPVGELVPGMAYLVRRLLENTSNAGWLRLGFVEQRPADELLAAPAPGGPAVVAQPARRWWWPFGASTSKKGSAVIAPLDAGPVLPPLAATSAGGGAAADAGDRKPAGDGFRNEPLRDFSVPDIRAAFRAALAAEAARAHVASPRVGATERPSRDIIYREDPSHSDRRVGEVRLASVEDAESAVAAAESAARPWARTPVGERARRLRALANRLRAERDPLAALMVLEVGKPWDEADADVCEAIDFCEYYASLAERLFEPRHTQRIVGEVNLSTVSPRGPTVVIAPWNFPLAILCGMSVAALVTGNPVIIKPAEQSSLIAARFVALALEAGFPPDAVGFLPGLGERVGAHLVAHPKVATIAFTGSLAVGTRIWATAADVRPGQSRLKRVICEMGGKNSIIVDEDADLDDAVLGVVRSAFGFAGQKCSACSRAIVVGARYETFLARLADAVTSLRFGSAHDPAVRVGPVVDAESRARLDGLVAQATSRARQITPPLDLPKQQGHYVSPVVFADVPPGDPLATHEHFGPVLAASSAPSLEAALAMANATAYALTGGVYSRLPSSIARVIEELEVGNLYINRPITGALVGRQPFGGMRLSGGGTKAGGPEYLLSFVELRVRTENTLRHGFTPDLF